MTKKAMLLAALAAFSINSGSNVGKKISKPKRLIANGNISSGGNGRNNKKAKAKRKRRGW